MAVITVFAFGTNQAKDQTCNIISEFIDACSSEHIVVDGPTTLGLELTDYALEAKNQIIDWLQNQESVENSLNMVGFSRGAVICTYIANMLKEHQLELEMSKELLTPREQKLLAQLGQLTASICALDPVAGLSDKRATRARVIPSNVGNYVSFLQRDEMRLEFKPQDMSRIIIESPKTKVSLLPLYGKHADGTRILHSNMTSAAEICSSVVYQFLSAQGTEFKSLQPDALPFGFNEPDAKKLLSSFTKHYGERDDYLKFGQMPSFSDSLPIPRNRRSLNKYLDYYVKNSYYFVNELERGLFKIAYPKLFNYFFEQNSLDLRFPNDSASTQEEVVAELLKLKQENLDEFKRFVSVHELSSNVTALNIGNPRGVYSLEPCMAVAQIAPSLVPDLVKERFELTKELVNLERDIYQMTFRYQREKHDFVFYKERSQSQRAHDIREQVLMIVDGRKLDPLSKRQKIINVLEEHYFELVRMDSSSEIRGMLKKLLRHYGHRYLISRPSLPQVILASLVDVVLSFVKELINFIAHFGYIGGAVFYSVGHSLQKIAQRINELIFVFGDPWTYVFCPLFYFIDAVGFVLKHNLGIKPLLELVSDGVKSIRDAIMTLVLDIQIEPDVGMKTEREAAPTDEPPAPELEIGPATVLA